MRSLFSLLFVCAALFAFTLISPVRMIAKNDVIDDSRVQGSCMISQNNFNRSCIQHKIVYLFQKLPLVSGWSFFRAGPLELIKLPEYASSIVSAPEDETFTSRSFASNIVSVVSKSVESFLEPYGIKIRLPQFRKNVPGVVVEEDTNETHSVNEGRHKKKDQKKFALIFPLIATFKFILIKALLIPILMGILAIKKMLILAAMGIPMIIAMLRICRFTPGGLLGPAGFTAAAAATPLMAAPYVASDTIIGDFSNYAPALAAHQTPYYNKQTDYGGKSINPINALTPF